jgi:hypothetical protein
VQAIRGADVSSDHHLLVSAVRGRLKSYNINYARKHFDVGLIRTKETRAAFKIGLSNRFQPLQKLIEDNGTDIQTHRDIACNHGLIHVKSFWG